MMNDFIVAGAWVLLLAIAAVLILAAWKDR